MTDQLPKMDTDEYFALMNDVIAKFEKMLPVKVYGFTGYSRIAFNWILPSGKLAYETSSIPFDMLMALIEKAE